MTSPKTAADPREFASSLRDEQNLVFLYSGMLPGTKSFVAWGLDEKINDIKKIHSDKTLFGYLGYGLRHLSENVPHNKPSFIDLPDITMMSFKNVEEFELSKTFKPQTTSYTPPVIKSNMTDDEFKQKVAQIVEKIRAGELYQANLTRKFYGEFQQKPNGLDLFLALTEKSPAPYSAYMKFDDVEIISASPEKFITIENGIATTSPIKGTLSSESPAALLALSEKDRAENLMIVDLMRNDLSKTCKSVRVPKLFEISSYTKYHHMSSTITGEVAANPLDVVMGCFPPGSMTGAPKVHAMRLISELEGIERGVYSGALGYIRPNGDCDLSVVIRTLIIQGNKFEFQVGCGIVADSIPEKELEESYVKAKPIMEILAG